MTMDYCYSAARRTGVLLAGIIFATNGLITAYAQPTRKAIAPPADQRPNIIFILADHLGYGDLGCYGQRNIKTPNLDQLATIGTRFTSFYVDSPVSRASRQTFMYGRTASFPHANGDAATPDRPCLASLLQRAGYYTSCVGEWGLPGNPQQCGFNEWGGLLTEEEVKSIYPPYVWRYDPITPFDGKRELPGNLGNAGILAASDLFTTAATNVIRLRRPDQSNKYRPFFLFIGLCEPRVLQTNNLAPYDGEPWPDAERAKAAAITRLDTNVGKILAALKYYDQQSNTVIVFSSVGGPRKENGTDPAYHHSAGNFRSSEGGLLEGDLRVPCIISCLGKVAATSNSDLLCTASDILPTLAEVTRATGAVNGSGISLQPLLIGQPQTNRHDFLDWESHTDGIDQAIRMAGWKAVKHSSDSTIELFDLKTDLKEEQNLAKKEPATAGKLKDILNQLSPPNQSKH